MEIYANMYLWRQIDVLREDFPKLAVLLGDEAFYTLGKAFVHVHPSVHHSLSQLGRRLPQYLKEHPGSRPDLSDLAALEWARAEVFEEAAVPTASPSMLREMAAAGDFSCASLELVPALRLLRFDSDVLDVWQQLEDGHPVPAAHRAPSFAVVWRRELEVFHVQVQADEAKALALASAGEPLEVVCAAFEDRGDPVEAAFRAIGSWFAEGWICEPEEETARP
ncbi:hypothetical protein AKJ08_1212 [Vulgatibacter incomptus]|uniref:Putative DNA-binding domain-containing protein n=2 Tax=Vulgatibacter incomptus TaxID=1391653 RepID=A0A0K1PBC5_9BACT|nr:hypothetical protein AKJ08_1212 [Vulgatibacter incomptus]